MEHLFSVSGIFDHLVTRWVIFIVAACLMGAPIVLLVLHAVGRTSETTLRAAWAAYRTWLWLAPVVLGGILLCAFSAMVLITLFSILCYREFARATGLFRERLLSGIVVLGILCLGFACIDHWYNFFTAIPSLVIALIFGTSVLADRPRGYLQRNSLATVGLLLFGVGLGYLGYVANARQFRPILCMLLLCTQLSDVAGFVAGKAFGRHHPFPHTSPSKTAAGHVGSLLVVTPLVMWFTHLVFVKSPVDCWSMLLVFGLLVAVGAQLGDLVLSSVKRDLGLKDLASTLPGHGGFTDRFNSLLLVAPVAFHFLGYFVGFGLDREYRVITGHG